MYMGQITVASVYCKCIVQVNYSPLRGHLCNTCAESSLDSRSMSSILSLLLHAVLIVCLDDGKHTESLSCFEDTPLNLNYSIWRQSKQLQMGPACGSCVHTDDHIRNNIYIRNLSFFLSGLCAVTCSGDYACRLIKFCRIKQNRDPKQGITS